MGIDAKAHAEAFANRLQPPAKVFVAEEGDLDRYQRERGMQLSA